MKLGLGTVQLGLPYGVANTTGKPTQNEAIEILQEAHLNGIDCFDTAKAYGDSETLIGFFISEFDNRPCQVSTKISPFPFGKGQLGEAYLREEVDASLKRLGGRIEYLLFHRAADLIENAPYIERVMTAYQQVGAIGKVGVSVYSPEEAISAINAYPVQVIQAPVNVFDHRMLMPDIQDRLSRYSIELHARSIFLQGLLCMSKEQIPSRLAHVALYAERFQDLCAEHHLFPTQVAVAYVRDQKTVDRFFIGCESLVQLRHNISLYNSPPLPPEMKTEIDLLFDNVPVKVINPSLW